MALQVAVASKTGAAVDEHFGHAKAFHIYTIDTDGARLLEIREVAHYCLGGHGDQSALSNILNTIADCDAVFVARVGDGPAEKLLARGIEPISDHPWEEVVPALTNWFGQRMTQTREQTAC